MIEKRGEEKERRAVEHARLGRMRVVFRALKRVSTRDSVCGMYTHNDTGKVVCPAIWPIEHQPSLTRKIVTGSQSVASKIQI